MVNSPAKGAKIDLSEKNTITWSSVSTDPSTFTLALVDQTTMGSIVIDAKVTTSDDKFDLTNVVAPPGAKYKFNFLSNDPLNNGILAQSETFEIVKSEKSSSSSSAAANSADESSTTGESATTFKTASSTKASGTSPAGETANASSTPSSAAATKTPNAAASLDKSFALGGGVLAALLMLF
jgi:hypothetical protein